MEMMFHSHENKTHFHKKGCALGLILKVRVFGTRKWPTRFMTGNAVSNSFAHPVIEGNAEAECTQLPLGWVSCTVLVECTYQTVLFNSGGLDVGDFAIKLARVNCFDWNDVCEKNNITIYPTIKMFR